VLTMPTDSYHDDLIDRLGEDPEYASLYLQTVLSEALEDGYMDAFPLALRDVLEATKNRQNTLSEIDILRQHLYKLLSKANSLTPEVTIAALEAVGFSLEMKPLEVQLSDTSY
ncbi:MAG: hypothetical protein WBB01_09770, partial [Phormidesmis sp.]